MGRVTSDVIIGMSVTNFTTVGHIATQNYIFLCEIGFVFAGMPPDYRGFVFNGVVLSLVLFSYCGFSR